jgi:hypothetical protein
MGKYGFDVMAFKITATSATTTYHDLAQYITEYSGMEILAELMESHTMGDSWKEYSFTGLKSVSPITIGGFYDDVGTSGPHALLGNASDIGAERVVKVNFGTTNAYPKCDVIVKRYSRKPVRGELTKFEAELQPTGEYSVTTT